jgi:hypothetical protein
MQITAGKADRLSFGAPGHDAAGPAEIALPEPPSATRGTSRHILSASGLKLLPAMAGIC